MSLLATFQQKQAQQLSAIGMAPVPAAHNSASNGAQTTSNAQRSAPPTTQQQTQAPQTQTHAAPPHRSASPPAVALPDMQQALHAALLAQAHQQMFLQQYTQYATMQHMAAAMQQQQQQQAQQQHYQSTPPPPKAAPHRSAQTSRPASQPQLQSASPPPPPSQSPPKQSAAPAASSSSANDYAASVLGLAPPASASASTSAPPVSSTASTSASSFAGAPAASSSVPSLAPNPYATPAAPRSSYAPPPAAAAAAASSYAPPQSQILKAPLAAAAQSHVAASGAPAAALAPFPTPSYSLSVGGPSLSIGGPSLYIGPPIPAPPPAAAAAAAAARPGSLSAAAAGPTSSVVKSSTDAGVSISRSAPQTIEQLVCPECPPGAEVVIDPHQGVEVCTSCGLVIGQYISEESEWRTFSDRRGDDPNRVGGPEIGLLADAGLATLMGDSPNGLGSTLAKLQNKSAMSHNHRLLLDAFRKSSRISSLLSLPRSLTDRADELYKRVVESKQIRHRGADALIAACIFMVCKAEKVPRTIKEMCGVSDVDPKALGRAFKEMKRLGFHKALMASSGASRSSARDDDEEQEDECASYVARWGNHLRLPPRLIEAAKRIANQARHVLNESRDPSSLCGAALYIAAQCGTLADRRTYEAIQAECGISANTLRTVVRSIGEHKHSILPQEFHNINIEA